MWKSGIRLVAGLSLLMIAAVTWAGPVDLNTADAETIARELNGVGEARAQAIVAWRETHGAFSKAEDLLQVDGIGPHILDVNRANILLVRND